VGDTRQQIHRYTEDLVGLLEVRNDRLTGLGSLRELTGVVEMMLAIRNRYGHPLSVVMLVLDRPGSAGGDPAEPEAGGPLRLLAEVAAEVARASDFVARYRKDTLAVVLPQTESSGARVFCRRLEDLARNDGRLGPDATIRAGVSTATEGDDSAALLSRAEAALARARSTQGDRIQGDTEEASELAGCAAGE